MTFVREKVAVGSCLAEVMGYLTTLLLLLLIVSSMDFLRLLLLYLKFHMQGAFT